MESSTGAGAYAAVDKTGATEPAAKHTCRQTVQPAPAPAPTDARTRYRRKSAGAP